MPDIFRVQAVHKHVNGLPRDSFVNTFHIRRTAPGDVIRADAEAVAEKIRDFYVNDVPGELEGVMDQFSDVVAGTGHEVKVSIIDEATGANADGVDAPPVWTEVFDHLGRAMLGTSGGLPSEVAACLSYRNTSDGSVPPARRRGRIYIGPLIPGSMGEVNQVPSVSAAFRDFMLAAANKLHDDLVALPSSYQWCIYSRPFAGRGVIERATKPDLPAIAARPGSTHDIDVFWMDDTFDTQRRRGERPTTRTTLVA